MRFSHLSYFEEPTMSEINSRVCPECAESVPSSTGVDRRQFMRAVSGVVGAAAGASLFGGSKLFAEPAKASGKPAEALVKELFTGLSAEQKAAVCLPWNHGADSGLASRLKTHNAAPLGKGKNLGEVFTKPQQDLIKQTFKAILSGEESFERISRNG